MTTQSCRRCKKRLAVSRGNCLACRTAVRRLVSQGKTTEAQEIAAGRLLPGKGGSEWGRRRFG